MKLNQIPTTEGDKMGTIGHSDHPSNETHDMPKAARRIYIPYTSIKTECDAITKALQPVIDEVTKVAATHGLMKLPLTLLEPPPSEEQGYSDNASRIVHSALLKLDETKEQITLDQWKQYNKQYEELIAKHGSMLAEGNRQTHFKPEMDEVMARIGDYMEANGVPDVARKAFFGGDVSPRFLATVAILHAAAWLNQQQEHTEPK